ncbi:hypothetical protein JXA63_03985 [Candidatus Woesebacteria bacterium]|nr:hypothetical protein [Candidatus Woesebacteria bacterium]
MKELLVGTSNPAKVEQVRGALSPLEDILVVGVEDKAELPEVVEDGETAQENARKKSIAYAEALGTTVLSMDNALYFDGLEGDDRQPGLSVRRFAKEGERPNDNEILKYYSDLIGSLGQEVNGRWEFAVCVADQDGIISETTILSPRVFTSVPSNKVIEGYPLESLQKDPETGKYISEMSKDESDEFWNKIIGKSLQEFVSTLDL